MWHDLIMGAVAVLGAALAWDLIQANRRHGLHERPPADTPPGNLEDSWARVGSMDLDADMAVHHEWPGGWPVDPVPWEHLASDERIEEGYDDNELAPSPFVDAWKTRQREEYQRMTDMLVWPAPSEAEVARSRALHGYIPELDPGPEAAAPAPSPDQGSPGPAMAPPGSGVGDGIEWAVNATFKPPAGPGDLGPRAGAVLAAYEQRLGARREACT